MTDFDARAREIALAHLDDRLNSAFHPDETQERLASAISSALKEAVEEEDRLWEEVVQQEFGHLTADQALAGPYIIKRLLTAIRSRKETPDV